VSAVTGEGEGEPERRASVYGDGIPFVQWSLLWLTSGAVALVSIAFDILSNSAFGHSEWLRSSWPGTILGRDFTNLWVAGRLVLAQMSGCVFDIGCFQSHILQDLHIATVQNYSYPPSALFMAVPFALFPYYVALALWTLCGVCFFAWAARPLLPKGFPLWLSVLTPAATINIWNGHYGFVLGGLWLLFFHQLDRRPRRAGLFAGLLTFKPHLGIMVAVSSLRSRPTLISATVTAAALVVLSGIFFGWDTWLEFFTNTTAAQTRLLTTEAARFYFMMMPSPYVQFGRGSGGLVAQLFFAGAAVMLLVKHRRWDAFSAATATFLIVPYCFTYDMTVACLGFAIVLFERWNSLRRAQRASLLLAFFAPELVYFVGPIVPVALLAGLHVQLSLASEPSSEQEDVGNPVLYDLGSSPGRASLAG
jgi:hypothetical protein